MRALPAILFFLLVSCAGCCEQGTPLYPGVDQLHEHGVPENGGGLPYGEKAPREAPTPDSSPAPETGIPGMLEKYAP